MTMLRNFALAVTLALGAAPALAAETEAHIEDYAFSFEGPFGSFDTMQLQRGLQVYTEICAGCHGLKFVPIRSLHDETGPAIPEDQVRAYADQLLPIMDDETGEERNRIATDHFPGSQLPNAPDLSLMAKARAGFHGPYGLGLNQLFRGMGGPEYIVNILNGYTGEEKEEAGTVLYENHAFPGGWIAMAPPLFDEAVSFADEHANDQLSISKDVAAFLMWTAEPKLASRKEHGLQAVLILIVMSVLLYLTNKRIWAPVKRRIKGTTPAE